MRLLTDDDVRGLLRPADVIEAIAGAFRRDYRSTVAMPKRSRVVAPGQGVLLVMPCYDSAVPALGTKLVTFFERNPGPERLQATYVLLDPESGKLLALIAANYLTDVRTAATSAVATRLMARRDAAVLGIFGTGRQARSHIEVLRSVRTFSKVLVCGSSAGRSQEFARLASLEFGIPVEPADPRSCVANADVICTCTTSPKPVLEAGWLRPGTHLNLVGAFQPDKREVDSETIRRARVVVETYESALTEAGELLIPIHEGIIGRKHAVADLHEIVSGKKPGRVSQDEITVFKSLGCALEDLVTAELVYRKISRRGRT